MPVKNLILIIFVSIIVTSALYANLDNIVELFQKLTGYTSIVIYGTVTAPASEPSAQSNASTLTATVTQPEKEETKPAVAQETTAKVEQVEEKKQYVNQTILLQVINQTENLKVKLDKLRTSSRTVLDYYSSINDTEKTEKWVNVVVLFNQALDGMQKIQTYSAKDSATKEDIAVIKGVIGEVLKTLDKIVKLIRGG